MILIISDTKENTTNEVIKWLVLMDKNFIRVNENEYFEIIMKDDKLALQSDENYFFLDDIVSVWYRRGGIKFKRLRYSNEAVDLHMNEVQHWLEDYVLNIIESKPHINKQSKVHFNKLLVLEKAKKVGLDIPKYFLSNKMNKLLIGKTIVKPLAGNPMLQSITEDEDAMMYTNVVDKLIDNDVFISFFQEKIDKDFEIRIFYLNGMCWSTAIFSQNDNQTKVDFRKYNDDKPNRNVPYLIPEEIERKCQKLMKMLDLNSGSLDFIKKGNQYFFLEVNPIGQFLAHSDNCNYNLDKIIASNL
ncbi:grasp-with-spasm system ATP-grasp peptide maturase [Chryseobacterium sp. 3008163]|uniref:grasp-with-spasm system ATP-grasp peptide maturase n=1 Tax=Chryseobacterium sp. 3008163 TaxID=2478663 RepID=UPI000F0C35B3|nr:grasp-with-spasm system ATP-grasp peptide maturase [Chryseobacterium sp. 3008163]AYN00922.1 grasp-with-spasm system ATP-grasp peptide maturase [Chryseobacterium sp. 3008163]